MAVQKSHRSKSKKTLRCNLLVFKKNYSNNIKKNNFKKIILKNIPKFF